METSGGLPSIPDYGAKGDVHGLPPGRIIAPNQTFGGGALLEERMLSHEQITAIKQRTLSLYFYGFIAYRDFVGDDHELRFCYVYRFPTGLILEGLDKTNLYLEARKPTISPHSSKSKQGMPARSPY